MMPYFIAKQTIVIHLTENTSGALKSLKEFHFEIKSNKTKYNLTKYVFDNKN